MISPYTHGSGLKDILIKKNELKQLLHWAKVGVKYSRGGSYQDCIIETIKEYADLIDEPCKDFDFKVEVANP